MGKNNAGRPRIEIDFEEVDKLCAMHCTAEEIAGFFEISTDSLSRRIQEQLKPDGTYYANFAEYFAIKSSKGCITLREMQWRSASKGSVPMMIFLGKNLIGQTDKQTIDVIGETKIYIDIDEGNDESDSDEDNSSEDQSEDLQ